MKEDEEQLRQRKTLLELINSMTQDRAWFEEEFGKDNVWDTEEFKKTFHLKGFLAPFVGVIRKSDNVEGALTFRHHPRLYFDFIPESDHGTQRKESNGR